MLRPFHDRVHSLALCQSGNHAGSEQELRADVNPHISTHNIGTRIELAWHRTKKCHYVAVLARRHLHNEEWRVMAIEPASGREGYLMSEGWCWVSENAA